MLIVEFFGFSISAIVPEGPSSGSRAEPSTITTSPPPRPAEGSTFMAGFARGSVCRFPLWLTSSASATPRREAKKSLKTNARAEAGKTEPTSIIREIRETAFETEKCSRRPVLHTGCRLPCGGGRPAGASLLGPTISLRFEVALRGTEKIGFIPHPNRKFGGDRPERINGHATVGFTVPLKRLQRQFILYFTRG